jgi:sec-independent protein translocase protein TatB
MIFKRAFPVLREKSWADAHPCTGAGRNPLLSPPDILVIGALALIFFGPDQLPKVARKAGHVLRDVQNTSQSFIREMERAADDIELREAEAAIQRELEAPLLEDEPKPAVALEPEAEQHGAAAPETPRQQTEPGGHAELEGSGI